MEASKPRNRGEVDMVEDEREECHDGDVLFCIVLKSAEYSPAPAIGPIPRLSLTSSAWQVRRDMQFRVFRHRMSVVSDYRMCSQTSVDLEAFSRSLGGASQKFAPASFTSSHGYKMRTQGI